MGACFIAEGKISLALKNLRLPLARYDQVAQVVADVAAPGIGAGTITLVLRKQAVMGKPHLCFAVFFRNIKNDPGPRPLCLVFNEIQAGVVDQPFYLFARDKLCDLVFAVMEVLVPVSEFVAFFVAVPGYLSRPPIAHIGDGVKRLLRWRVTDRYGNGKIVIFHGSINPSAALGASS